MVDIEKRKEELRAILAEMERDIETLQVNISKARKDIDAVKAWNSGREVGKWTNGSQ